MKVIAISNHKGGVGKTTSTVNIGAALAKEGKRVLLIDLDPQANLSQSLGVSTDGKTIYGALKSEYPLTPVNVSENLDIIPSTLDLSGAEIELSTEVGRELILKELLDDHKKKYDYVFIDCPPSLGLLTINALTAASEIYIPLQAEYLAMQGLTKLVEVVDKVKKKLNKSLSIGGVFITQYDSRKVLNRNVFEAIESHFGDVVFKTKIRDNVALAEAPSMQQNIFSYNNSSSGAVDYSSLAKEILSKQSNTSKQ